MKPKTVNGGSLARLVSWFLTRRTSDLWPVAAMAGLSLAAGLSGLILTQTVGTIAAIWFLARSRPANAAPEPRGK